MTRENTNGQNADTTNQPTTREPGVYDALAGIHSELDLINHALAAYSGCLDDLRRQSETGAAHLLLLISNDVDSLCDDIERKMNGIIPVRGQFPSDLRVSEDMASSVALSHLRP